MTSPMPGPSSITWLAGLRQRLLEDGKPRDPYVLGRGDYQNRKEKVTATTPAWPPA
jgi:hypothetical protein